MPPLDNGHLTEEAVEGWLAVGVIDGWTETVDRLGKRFPMKYEEMGTAEGGSSLS